MPTAEPRVSIVIPTYNTGTYVLQAIDSVLSQSWPRVELIVVDDGSTDETPRLLAQALDQGKRFTVLRQPNAGQPAALNLGWTSSSGDFMGYLCADDLLRPDAVRDGVAALQAMPDAVLAYPDFGMIDGDGRPLREVRTPDYDERLLVAGFQCLPGPGALFRRDAWAAVGGWKTTLRNIPDVDFFLRLCQRGPFVRVPRVLADYRVHAGAITYRACSAERADEPGRTVDDLFATPGLPARFHGYERPARAHALLLSAFMHAYSGRWGHGMRRLAAAARLRPGILLSRRAMAYLFAAVRGPKGGR